MKGRKGKKGCEWMVLMPKLLERCLEYFHAGEGDVPKLFSETLSLSPNAKSMFLLLKCLIECCPSLA